MMNINFRLRKPCQLLQSEHQNTGFSSSSRFTQKTGDNSNLCAYIELRNPSGRRKAAEKLIMRTLPTLTRLVFIVHGNDYEFRKNLFTGVITGEKFLISRDAQEWALVKLFFIYFSIRRE